MIISIISQYVDCFFQIIVNKEVSNMSKNTTEFPSLKIAWPEV